MPSAQRFLQSIAMIVTLSAHCDSRSGMAQFCKPVGRSSAISVGVSMFCRLTARPIDNCGDTLCRPGAVQGTGLRGLWVALRQASVLALDLCLRGQVPEDQHLLDLPLLHL